MTEMPSFQEIAISIPHLERGSGDYCVDPQHSALRRTLQQLREMWENPRRTPETESEQRTT